MNNDIPLKDIGIYLVGGGTRPVISGTWDLANPEGPW